MFKMPLRAEQLDPEVVTRLHNLIADRLLYPESRLERERKPRLTREPSRRRALHDSGGGLRRAA
jgi:hypothetical protein